MITNLSRSPFWCFLGWHRWIYSVSYFRKRQRWEQCARCDRKRLVEVW